MRPKKQLVKPKSVKSIGRHSSLDGQFSGDFARDYRALQAALTNSADLQCNIIHTADMHQIGLFYYPDLVNKDLLSKSIVKPLQDLSGPLSADIVSQQVLDIPETSTGTAIEPVADRLSDGAVALLLEGEPNVVLAQIIQLEHRGIERSQSEDVIIGPHESFSESLAQNIAVLRRVLATHKLKMVTVQVGRLSRTQTAVLYLEDVAQQKLVNETLERLRRIEIDYIEGASHLRGFLEDTPLSLFPLLRVTERPSRVAGVLIEGRVAVLAQGDPTALIVPTFLPEYVQSSEDYFDKPLVGTFLRWIRLISVFLAVFLPGIWIALTVFHHGIIPPPLFNSIVSGREGVPLPSVLEAFLLLLAFDIVVEASTRLPNAVGQAIGIVGAIILGQSAVQASLVSPTMTIVVALTGLAVYTLPSPAMLGPVRILKYLVMILSSVFGLYGTVWSLIGLTIYTCSLRSFGYPFFYPLGPFHLRGMLDIVVRLPSSMRQHRPYFLAAENDRRMAEGLSPWPGKEPGDEA